MNRPTGRVLTLLELLQSGGVRTAAELADRLGVDVRTVRRYVAHLLDLGIPVESVRGRYGGYRLARGYRLPPLMLGDDEALAVLLGLLAGRRSGLLGGPPAGLVNGLGFGLGGGLGVAGETASAKIRRVLPRALDDRLQAVLDSIAFTDPASSIGRADVPDAATLLTVADAVAYFRPIAVAYTDRAGLRTDRVLHPYGIVSHGDRWYVRALEPALGEERTFRLDRIADARALPGSFEPPGDRGGGGDVAQSVLTGFATADYRYEVTLRVHGTVEQIRTRFPVSVARIQAEEARETEEPPDADQVDQVDHTDQADQAAWHRLDIRAERLEWLPPTLAALDLPFEIEGPDELRDLVVAFAERFGSRARAA